MDKVSGCDRYLEKCLEMAHHRKITKASTKIEFGGISLVRRPGVTGNTPVPVSTRVMCLVPWCHPYNCDRWDLAMDDAQ